MKKYSERDGLRGEMWKQKAKTGYENEIWGSRLKKTFAQVVNILRHYKTSKTTSKNELFSNMNLMFYELMK